MTWNCVANDSKTNDTPFGSLMDETENCVVGDRNGLHNDDDDANDYDADGDTSRKGKNGVYVDGDTCTPDFI